MRASGGAGILYDSLRHAGGINVIAYRPRNVTEIVQAGHFEIAVETGTSRIEARTLAG